MSHRLIHWHIHKGVLTRYRRTTLDEYITAIVIPAKNV